MSKTAKPAGANYPAATEECLRKMARTELGKHFVQATQGKKPVLTKSRHSGLGEK